MLGYTYRFSVMCTPACPRISLSVFISKTDLNKMYEAHKNFDTTCPTAKNIKMVLDYLNKMFPSKVSELKWYVIAFPKVLRTLNVILMRTTTNVSPAVKSQTG